MTAIFFGHGSPMNAIENNFYTESWKRIAQEIKIPKAILVISAHWETFGTRITDNEKQKIIYDFYGFPSELFEVQYDAKGEKKLAQKINNLIPEIATDNGWGLDHGAWSILKHLYPKSEIPVLQLSLDRNKTPKQHFDFAKKLQFLREEEVLIIGSGNIVHNLAMIDWRNGKKYDWAEEFSNKIKDAIIKKDYDSVIDFHKNYEAKYAVPTQEHFLPLLYVLALAKEEEKFKFFAEGIDLSSIDMTSLMIV